jgi:hypothetical protein
MSEFILYLKAKSLPPPTAAVSQVVTERKYIYPFNCGHCAALLPVGEKES